MDARSACFHLRLHTIVTNLLGMLNPRGHFMSFMKRHSVEEWCELIAQHTPIEVQLLLGVEGLSRERTREVLRGIPVANTMARVVQP
jgi:hypothetical protein